ncbi:VWA domain-containing protein [Catellatospora sp. NPDC049133]|jgi:Ca-activated chloride channel family protein|uniref:VWA domain-containing protein n=1 Tax=Catellatospora sp. NPDC049133 TaxID=3155499 RepID=UPI0033CE6A33
MTVQYPFLIALAVVGTGAAVLAYLRLQRRRTAVLRGAGLGLTAAGGRGAVRRHLPYVLFLAALPMLLVGLARPHAELPVPRVSGTVMLVFDVSNSMAATDVEPSRLAAAQSAAQGFVDQQPSTVDIGVVIFGQGGLLTQTPTDDRAAVKNAITRLSTSGSTSLRQAILTALSAIVGEPVELPTEEDAAPPDLGYWGSATIIVFSDGQETESPEQAQASAALAGAAGVRIETVGIGTPEGATVEVEGFQVATALDEQLLTELAAVTGGTYHPARDAAALNDIHRSIDLRITTEPEHIELTALFAGSALLLLTLGGLLMIRWYGRIV